MEKIKTYADLLEKIKNEEKFLLYIKSEGCSVCEADFPKVKEITNKNNYTSYYIQADEMAEAMGQLKAGFILTNIEDDTDGEGRLHEMNIPTFIMTRAIK